MYYGLDGIKELRDLEEGWDGDDAALITEEALERAEYILLNLPNVIRMPSVVPYTDGGISMTWGNSTNKAIELSIPPSANDDLEWSVHTDVKTTGSDIDILLSHIERVFGNEGHAN